MKLTGFKNLLLRKVQDTSLNEYIESLCSIDFGQFIYESLAKMASINNNDMSNHATNWMAKNMLPQHADMYRDALSHHTTQYNAALKGKKDDIANQHMNQIMNLLHMGTRLGKHTYKSHDGSIRAGSDKLDVEAIPDQPWTKNALKMPPGNFGRSIKKPTAENNYDVLKGSPHISYGSEIRQHAQKGNDFTGGWPVEHTKVNGKYITVDHDAETPTKYTPHVFDTHPIMEHHRTPQHKMTPEDHKDFIKKATEWHSPDNKAVEAWFDEQDAKEAKRKAEGKGPIDTSKPSAPVHPTLEEYDPSSGEKFDTQKHKFNTKHDPSWYAQYGGKHDTASSGYNAMAKQVYGETPKYDEANFSDAENKNIKELASHLNNPDIPDTVKTFMARNADPKHLKAIGWGEPKQGSKKLASQKDLEDLFGTREEAAAREANRPKKSQNELEDFFGTREEAAAREANRPEPVVTRKRKAMVPQKELDAYFGKKGEDNENS